ncbi:hypothetical protein Pint_03137 [Pistacia integerrima]|uniref:Uncharacterized protein n=1 Tax=Pistacia integerrima TaxID=434235 RepID=A0ACC0ZNS4_9ROSI|nr:hypothetical protein Pint_03137 [Pistacia integerrima]
MLNFFFFLISISIPISCSSISNRRILHQPFLPLDSLPPSEPPSSLPSPPPPPSPSTPKFPFSSSTTTPNSPFFPSYPSPPPPPSPSSFASFPANISSLILPHSPEHSKPNSPKLLILAVVSVLCACLVAGILLFLYFRRRRLKTNCPENDVKSNGHSNSNSNSTRSYAPNVEPINTRKLRTTRTSSSEFLYLGTLVNSRGGIDDSSTTDSRVNSCVSPELRPLPPLAQQASFRENHNENADVASSMAEEEEEFYSPRISLGGTGTGSGSRREFASLANGESIGGRNSDSSSCSCSSSSSRSLSASISPPISLSPKRSESEPKSPEITQPPPIQSVFAMASPLQSSPDRNVQSPLLSIASTSPDTGLSPSRYNLLDRNVMSSASTSPDRESLSSDILLQKNQELSLRLNNASSLSSASTSPDRVAEKNPDGSVRSSFSFSPDRISKKTGNDSPRKSDISGQSKQSSLSSSPERISDQSPHRSSKKTDSPRNSDISDQSSPDESPRSSSVSDRISSPVRRNNAGSSAAATSTSTSTAASTKTLGRPFVIQNPTKVSPVELLSGSNSVENNVEESSKPKLKPLHWDKVRASSDREMVWDHLRSSSFKLNEEMIETLFVVNTPNSKPNQTTPRSVLPSPNQENRVLDPKKSQNIAILLRALNVTVEEVCEALLEGNAETLGTELLESLLKMAPTKEEERKLKEYKDDSPSKLGSAEKFLKAVLDVPFAFKRVDAMLYITNFESEVEYLKKSFETLEAACEELRNSRMFLKLLEAVLKTGNRMNVGTNRGDAHAFKLDTLLKLVDVKGADGKTTLLHFVVQEIIRTEGARLSGTSQNPDDAKCRKLGLQVVSGLSSELTSVKKSAAMDSDVLSSDVSKLSRGLANISEVVRLIETQGSDESSNKFSESMNRFIRMAEEEIIRIQAQESVALSLVKEITEYFHGNSAKEEAHPFRIFMVVRDFLTVLDRVCKEVGMINERTIVSSAHKFPVPINPMLPVPVNPTVPQSFTGFPGRQQYSSSDDDSTS